jgi:glycosyltransferase involved in cell wall biosynthesis
MKISVVTPSFNSSEFIERTIRSVLGQEGAFELEYFVIDGGSTDGTQEILRRYDGALQWVSEPDSGQSNAINKGLKLASGDVVAFLNSDDVYQTGALQAVADFFQTSDKCWAFGKADIIDEDDKQIQRWITRYKNFFLTRYSYSRLLAENFISQPAVFWRRALLNEVGFLNEDEHYVMDYDYWLRIGRRFEPGLINQYLASFRWQSSSKGRTGYRRQFSDEYRVAKKYAKGQVWPVALHSVNYHKITAAYWLIDRLSQLSRSIPKIKPPQKQGPESLR